MSDSVTSEDAQSIGSSTIIPISLDVDLQTQVAEIIDRVEKQQGSINHLRKTVRLLRDRVTMPDGISGNGANPLSSREQNDALARYVDRTTFKNQMKQIARKIDEISQQKGRAQQALEAKVDEALRIVNEQKEKLDQTIAEASKIDILATKMESNATDNSKAITQLKNGVEDLKIKLKKAIKSTVDLTRGETNNVKNNLAEFKNSQAASITALKDEVAALRQEIAEMKASNSEDHSKSFNEINEVKTKLETIETNTSTKIEELTQEVKNNEKSNEDISNKLNDLQTSYTLDCEQRREHDIEVDNEFSKVKLAAEGAETELKTQIEKIGEINEKVDQTTENVNKKITDQINNLQKSIDELADSSYQQIETTKTDLLKTIKDKIEEENQLISELQNDTLTKIDGDKAELIKQVESLKQEMNQKNGETASSVKEVQENMQKLDSEFKSRFESFNVSVGSMNSEASSIIQGQVNEIRKTQNEHKESINNLQKLIDEKQESTNSKIGSLEESNKSKLSEVETQLAELKKGFDENSSSLKQEIEANYFKFTQHEAETKEKSGDLNTKLSDLTQKFELHEAAYTEKTGEITGKVQTLNDSLNLHVKSLSEQNVSIASSLEEIMNLVDENKDNISKLGEKLKEFEQNQINNNNSQKIQIDDINSRIQGLNINMDSMSSDASSMINSELKVIKERQTTNYEEFSQFKTEVESFKESSTNDTCSKYNELKQMNENAIKEYNSKFDALKQTQESSIAGVDSKLEEIKQNNSTTVDGINAKIEEIKLNLDNSINSSNTKIEEVKQQFESLISTKINETSHNTNTKIEEIKRNFDKSINDINKKFDSNKQNAESSHSLMKQHLEEAINQLNSKFDELRHANETAYNTANSKIDNNKESLENSVYSLSISIYGITKQIEETVANTDVKIKEEVSSAISKTDGMSNTINSKLEEIKQSNETSNNELNSKINEIKQNLENSLNSTDSKINEAKQNLESSINNINITFEENKKLTDASLAEINNKINDIKAGGDIMTKNTIENNEKNIQSLKEQNEKSVSDLAAKMEESMNNFKSQIIEVGQRCESSINQNKIETNGTIDTIRNSVEDEKKSRETAIQELNENINSNIVKSIENNQNELNELITNTKSELQSLVETKVTEIVANEKNNQQSVNTQLGEIQTQIGQIIKENITTINETIKQVQSSTNDQFTGITENITSIQKRIEENKQLVEESINKLNVANQEKSESIQNKLGQNEKSIEESIEKLRLEQEEKFKEIQSKFAENEKSVNESLNCIKTSDEEKSNETQEQIKKMKEEQEKTISDLKEDISKLGQALEERCVELDKVDADTYEKLETYKDTFNNNFDSYGQILSDTVESFKAAHDELIEKVNLISENSDDVLGKISGEFSDRLHTMEDKFDSVFVKSEQCAADFADLKGRMYDTFVSMNGLDAMKQKHKNLKESVRLMVEELNNAIGAEKEERVHSVEEVASVIKDINEKVEECTSKVELESECNKEQIKNILKQVSRFGRSTVISSSTGDEGGSSANGSNGGGVISSSEMTMEFEEVKLRVKKLEELNSKSKDDIGQINQTLNGFTTTLKEQKDDYTGRLANMEYISSTERKEFMDRIAELEEHIDQTTKELVDCPRMVTQSIETNQMAINELSERVEGDLTDMRSQLQQANFADEEIEELRVKFNAIEENLKKTNLKYNERIEKTERDLEKRRLAENEHVKMWSSINDNKVAIDVQINTTIPQLSNMITKIRNSQKKLKQIVTQQNESDPTDETESEEIAPPDTSVALEIEMIKAKIQTLEGTSVGVNESLSHIKEDIINVQENANRATEQIRVEMKEIHEHLPDKFIETETFNGLKEEVQIIQKALNTTIENNYNDRSNMADQITTIRDLIGEFKMQLDEMARQEMARQRNAAERKAAKAEEYSQNDDNRPLNENSTGFDSNNSNNNNDANDDDSDDGNNGKDNDKKTNSDEKKVEKSGDDAKTTTSSFATAELGGSVTTTSGGGGGKGGSIDDGAMADLKLLISGVENAANRQIRKLKQSVRKIERALEDAEAEEKRQQELEKLKKEEDEKKKKNKKAVVEEEEYEEEDLFEDLPPPIITTIPDASVQSQQQHQQVLHHPAVGPSIIADGAARQQQQQLQQTTDGVEQIRTVQTIIAGVKLPTAVELIQDDFNIFFVLMFSVLLYFLVSDLFIA